jgi:hypothetical protein
MTNSQKLDLVKPIGFLAIFIVVIAILFFFLSSANSNRKEAVYQTYATETDSYINQNKENLIILFTILRGENPPCEQNTTNPPFCPVPSRTELIGKLSQNLKDWSSTGFIYQTKFSEAIFIARLSGESQELYIYPPEKRDQVKKLLSGEVERVSWDEYSYEFSTKEVIIPVKDNSGKVIGAIIRGVIEQNSF